MAEMDQPMMDDETDAGGVDTPGTAVVAPSDIIAMVNNYDIPVTVSAVLGRAVMTVDQLLKLNRGQTIELDRRLGQPIDIYVNNRLVARGEVVITDERLGITMTETVKSEKKF